MKYFERWNPIISADLIELENGDEYPILKLIKNYSEFFWWLNDFNDTKRMSNRTWLLKAILAKRIEELTHKTASNSTLKKLRKLVDNNRIIINEKMLRWNSIMSYDIMKTVTKIIWDIRKFNEDNKVTIITKLSIIVRRFISIK